MTNKITAKLAAKLLRQARNDKGADYVDPKAAGSSRYTPTYFKRDGSPGCLVGHVLAYADVRPFSPRSSDNKLGIDQLISKYPDLFTERAATVLSKAQEAQDGGDTWGNAVKFATADLH